MKKPRQTSTLIWNGKKHKPVPVGISNINNVVLGKTKGVLEDFYAGDDHIVDAEFDKNYNKNELQPEGLTYDQNGTSFRFKKLSEIKSKKKPFTTTVLKNKNKSFSNFAIQFANSFDKLSFGVYKSNNGKYTIIIYSKYPSPHDGSRTNIRIAHSTKNIEIIKRRFKTSSIPTRIFFLLWCDYKVNKSKTGIISDSDADKKAYNTLINLKSKRKIKAFDKEILFKDYIRVVATNPNNLDRVKLFMNLLRLKSSDK